MKLMVDLPLPLSSCAPRLVASRGTKQGICFISKSFISTTEKIFLLGILYPWVPEDETERNEITLDIRENYAKMSRGGGYITAGVQSLLNIITSAYCFIIVKINYGLVNSWKGFRELSTRVGGNLCCDNNKSL